jgi:catalase
MGKTHLEKLDSPAAFFKKALHESWAQAKQLAESAKEKQGEERKAKQLEKGQAIEDAKQKKQRQYQAVSEKFVTLPEEKRSELLKEFAGTLAASNQAIFRKSGIGSKMLSATFAKWLLENQV